MTPEAENQSHPGGIMPKPLSPLDEIPPPRAIHAHMGELYRELSLLRRLLRLSQQAETRSPSRPASPDAKEVRRAD